MPISMLREFLRYEAAGGIILVAAAALALIVANSPAAVYYEGFLGLTFAVTLGAVGLEKPLLLWINDGLMAVFFLLVGLEIKREVMEGQLSSRIQATLPVVAAVGGMAIPALVYVALNVGNPETLNGWAIPAATDIAFALGVLSLLGTRAPTSLKVFLTALAIIDDLGAIVIIAMFYTQGLSLTMLGLAAVAVAVLVAMNLLNVRSTGWYVMVGVALWVFVLKSGVHATLAGVVLALAIPLKPSARGRSMAHDMEHHLHPYVAYFILPVFAFANAGVSLAGITFESLLAPLPLGIALGLFVGKQIGVFAFTWAAVKAGIARMPENATWMQIYGVSLLTGIGFTMSLFIGTLAFETAAYAADVRIGVLSGSILSAVLGYAVLRFSARKQPAEKRPQAEAAQ